MIHWKEIQLEQINVSKMGLHQVELILCLIWNDLEIATIISINF